MVTLTSEQCTRLLAAFEAAASAKRAEGAEGPAEGAERVEGTETEGLAAVDTWARRLYAPMHVHAPWMADVRAALGARYPAHVVAFDVLFATAPGARVAWHCDYDSLGPFEVGDANAALRDDHFVSVHFNLTRGGALRTLPWRWLSYLHYWVIVRVGIFHAVHLHLNRACAVLFAPSPARTRPPRASATPSPTCASTPSTRPTRRASRTWSAWCGATSSSACAAWLSRRRARAASRGRSSASPT